MQKYYEALQFAGKLHDGHLRKGTNTPYLTHLMIVSSYVFEFGGDVDQAIAGLLHDAIEDQGDKTSFEDIEKLFGKEVSRIVKGCTDSEENPKPPWKERKTTYLKNLKGKDSRIKLVVACDKLHNSQAIVRDVKLFGAKVWKRFSASPDNILWYYISLAEGLSDLESPVVHLLKAKVDEMKTLISIK